MTGFAVDKRDAVGRRGAKAVLLVTKIGKNRFEPVVREMSRSGGVSHGLSIAREIGHCN